MKDGQLFHILSYGQGSMSPMAAQLSRAERWEVINYIRDMQQRAPAVDPPAEATEPAAAAEPTNESAPEDS